MNMSIGFSPPQLLLAPGSQGTAQLVLFNAGATTAFTIQFTDSQGLLANSQSITVQVPQGQSVSTPLNVVFPATLAAGIIPQLTAAAAVSGDTSRTGSSTLTVWPGAP
jgi:hypothetical protein